MTFLLILGYLVIGYGVSRFARWAIPDDNSNGNEELAKAIVFHIFWPAMVLALMLVGVWAAGEWVYNRIPRIDVAAYARAVYGVKPSKPRTSRRGYYFDRSTGIHYMNGEEV